MIMTRYTGFSVGIMMFVVSVGGTGFIDLYVKKNPSDSMSKHKFCLFVCLFAAFVVVY